MFHVTDVTVHPCEQSQYIKPVRIKYHQHDRKKAWDAMKVHDSVAIVVFNTTRQVLIFVKQFRPAIYINSVETYKDDEGNTRVDMDTYPSSLGLTIELCAGIIDKDHSPQEIAQMEVLEECGYKVPLDSLHKVTSFRGGVGTTGSVQTLFYAEVTDAMRDGHGGGLEAEGELIEVVEMTLEEGRKLIFDETVNRPVSGPIVKKEGSKLDYLEKTHSLFSEAVKRLTEEVKRLI